MAEKKVIDLNLLACECNLSSQNIDEITANIDRLKNTYNENELVTIYNHFLTLAKDEQILMHLIKCVDEYRDKSSLNPIMDLLLNKENPTNLRIMAAKACANYKDTSVVTPILYCLNNKDENYKLRLACADALGRVGDKYAVSPLIEIVKDEDEKSVYVRESAAVALGMLGDISAIDPLVSILESKKGFMDKFTFLKERIIEVLGKFNTNKDSVIKAYEHALTDDSACVRINAIEALMNSEDPKAYDLIKKMLKDEDDEVKKNALVALYNMSGVEILDEVKANDEYNEFLKEEAQNLIDEYETSEDD